MEPTRDRQASEQNIMFKDRQGNDRETINVVSLLFINLVIHCHRLALRILMSSHQPVSMSNSYPLMVQWQPRLAKNPNIA